MGKERRIDSIFKRKRVECQETGGVGDVPEPSRQVGHTVRGRKRVECQETETPVQPPLLLLEFGQQTHEEQGHQTHTTQVQFRGIEFLERDPALRPQIWQYPHNQRDEVRRAYLKLGPMQPLLDNYKASGEQGHQRRFKYNWFGMFPSWLEYSESRDRAYCLFCFVSSRNKNKRGGSDVFTVHGFFNWKKGGTEYTSWRRYRAFYSTPESDRDFLRYWATIVKKMKWLVQYVLTVESSYEWCEIRSKAAVQAVRIAADFPHMTMELAAYGLDEYIWTARTYLLFVKDLDGVFYEIWCRVNVDHQGFRDALKQVYAEKKFPARDRNMGYELEYGNSNMELLFRQCTQGLTKNVSEYRARELIAQEIHWRVGYRDRMSSMPGRS